jgi:hypothetical protein
MLHHKQSTMDRLFWNFKPKISVTHRYNKFKKKETFKKQIIQNFKNKIIKVYGINLK